MGKEVTKSAEFRSFCPVATSLDLLGDKWTLLILRDMIWAHKTMFKEFKESPEKMPSKMLSNRLKKLEGLGFISKNKGIKNNKNIYYFLEPRGIDVFPIMIELSIFSTKHFFCYVETDFDEHYLLNFFEKKIYEFSKAMKMSDSYIYQNKYLKHVFYFIKYHLI
jgi:DNA-binding HxlR family transcriptional regulator